MASRLLVFCFAIFVSAILLCLAVSILAEIWPWLLGITLAIGVIWLGVTLYRWRRNGW